MNKNSNKNKAKYITLLIFLLVLIFIFLNTYYQSRLVHFKNYDFVITKIEETPTRTVIPFNGNVEEDMWQYTFYPWNIIRVGDSIHKGAEEEYLYIFRKENNVNYRLKDSIKPTGMYSWNYKK